MTFITTQLKNNILILAAGVLLMLSASLVFASPASAAEIKQNLCAGSNLSLAKKDAKCNPGDDRDISKGEDSVNRVITSVINIFSVIVGIVAVIMIIIGGFRYIVSGGDSGNVTNAKNTILYALIGLVIVALAQFIVRFVLGKTSEI